MVGEGGFGISRSYNSLHSVSPSSANGLPPVRVAPPTFALGLAIRDLLGIPNGDAISAIPSLRTDWRRWLAVGATPLFSGDRDYRSGNELNSLR